MNRSKRYDLLALTDAGDDLLLQEDRGWGTVQLPVTDALLERRGGETKKCLIGRKRSMKYG